MNQIENEDYISSEEEATQGQKLVPIAESIRYRKRAQSAEKKIELLEKELAENKSMVQQLNRKLDNSQTEQQLLTELTSAQATDIEAATLLVKKRLEKNEDAEIKEIVAGLKKEKGYLFDASFTPAAAGKTAGVKEKMSSGVRQKFAPLATTIEFSPMPSTTIIATPVAVSAVEITSEQSIASAFIPARSCSPNASLPRQAIIRHEPPIRATATA